MHRLGGSVISVADTKATSLAKGESIADMARVVGSYADIIVIRHPWEGTAKVVADYAGVPVINAGDGSHEAPHPDPVRPVHHQERTEYYSGIEDCAMGRF